MDKQLVAAHRRTCDHHHKRFVLVGSSNHRRNDPALGVARDADAARVDVRL
jgi:hypothetical protein